MIWRFRRSSGSSRDLLFQCGASATAVEDVETDVLMMNKLHVGVIECTLVS